jgi:hypothetical protein
MEPGSKGRSCKFEGAPMYLIAVTVLFNKVVPLTTLQMLALPWHTTPGQCSVAVVDEFSGQ